MTIPQVGLRKKATYYSYEAVHDLELELELPKKRSLSLQIPILYAFFPNAFLMFIYFTIFVIESLKLRILRYLKLRNVYNAVRTDFMTINQFVMCC